MIMRISSCQIASAFSAFLVGILACTHGEIRMSPQQPEAFLNKVQIELDLTQSDSELHVLAEKINKIVKKKEKEIDENDLFNIEQFYSLYQAGFELANSQKLRIPAYSKIKIKLPSFCLDPNKAIPSTNETFDWTKEDTEIPYYAKVIGLISNETSYPQEDIQELIWNLRNKTRFENYPPHLQKILERIDPNVKFILPSRIGDAVSGEAEKVIRDHIPEIGVTEDTFSLLQERYYTYKEISSRLRTKAQVQSSKKPEIVALQDKITLYASTQSNGFNKQEVIFYNPNGSAAYVNVSEYHLRPFDHGTQRIGIYADADLWRKFASYIEMLIKDAIIRNSAYWYHGQVTQSEATFIKSHPIEALNAYAQSRRAIISTWKHFGRNTEGDESDAFRHFIWAGLLLQQLGEARAREYLSAHEELAKNKTTSDKQASEMDKYNNQEGLRTAKSLAEKNKLSLAHLEKEALDAIAHDRLKIIRSQGKNTTYPVSHQEKQ
ncbi:MAG: hypothetical protein AABZ06_08715 [Bdellovibrionota bacterium]